MKHSIAVTASPHRAVFREPVFRRRLAVCALQLVAAYWQSPQFKFSDATSIEAMRTIRDEETRTATSTFTQLPICWYIVFPLYVYNYNRHWPVSPECISRDTHQTLCCHRDLRCNSFPKSYTHSGCNRLWSPTSGPQCSDHILHSCRWGLQDCRDDLNTTHRHLYAVWMSLRFRSGNLASA